MPACGSCLPRIWGSQAAVGRRPRLRSVIEWWARYRPELACSLLLFFVWPPMIGAAFSGGLLGLNS